MLKSSTPGKPLVSVITAVLNGEKYLEQAIQSVIHQPYDNIEYIIMDGSSGDDTLNIIRRYDSQIDYWVSEEDKGIYNAMNKGWEISRGIYIYFLGSDDILLNLPVTAIQDAYARGIPIVCGNVQLSNGDLFKSSFGRAIMYNNTVHHQGLFLEKSVSETGPFDESYQAFADFDLNQRLYKRGLNRIQVNEIVARCHMGGVSGKAAPREFFRVIYRNFGPWAVILAFLLAKYRGIVWRFGKRSFNFHE